MACKAELALTVNAWEELWPLHSLAQIPQAPQASFSSPPNGSKNGGSAEPLNGLGNLQSAVSVEGVAASGSKDTWAFDGRCSQGFTLAPVSQGIMLQKKAECSCSGLTELSGCFSPISSN